MRFTASGSHLSKQYGSDMTPPDQPREKPRYRPSRKSAPFYCIVVVVIGCGFWLWFDSKNTLSALGILISTVGVLLAWAIYDLQAAAGKASDDLTKSGFNATRDAITTVTQDVSRIASGLPVEDSLTDPYEKYSDWMDSHGKELTPGFRTVNAPQVPLLVVADLVRGWDLDVDIPGSGGKWLVERLVAAVRKTGRGNFSWFVIMSDPAQGFRVFRVSKGGQAKAEPTTVEITDWRTRLKKTEPKEVTDQPKQSDQVDQGVREHVQTPVDPVVVHSDRE